MKEGKLRLFQQTKLFLTMHEARDLPSMSPSMSSRYTLTVSQLHLAGWCGMDGWCYSFVGDHLETFCLPQATLRSQLESWRSGR